MSQAEGAVSWTNRVKNGEILYRVAGKRNLLYVIQRKKTNLDIICLVTDP